MTRPSAMSPWLNFQGKRKLTIVRQAAATECGLACVAMLADYHGIPSDIDGLRRRYGVSLKGATLSSIDRVCRALGLKTRAVRCTIDELRHLDTPCILHWRFSHFVVLATVHKGGMIIHDPARGVVRENPALVREAFTGIALETKPSQAIRRTERPLKLRVANLISNGNGIARKFVAGLLLALVGELLLLTSPFYLQVVIDRVIATGDLVLLNVLAVAFSMLLVFQLAANVMRQLTFLFLGHVLSFDMTARVLHRLLSLPLSFFRSRELGEVQHRVQSLRRIQEFVVQGAPALLLDSIFVVAISVVLIAYDPLLSLAMLGCLSLWCLWRVCIFRRSLTYANDIAHAESCVQTHFLESLRAMQAIRVSNGEARRERDWCNLFANATNARIRAGKLQVLDGTVRQFLFQGARIAAIFYLARGGIAREFSIGAISAYVAYLAMFTTRGAGIVDRITEYRLLDVPLGRVADIVFSNEESTGCRELEPEAPSIELKNVSFAYARDDPPILRNCSVSVPHSSLTVIAGRSGTGKSTLLHLIAGNELPSDGEVLLNGHSGKQINIRSLRSRMSAVLQDDNLLRGSVSENIAFFAARPDMQRIRKAAESACIAKDIAALPMAYETRIADLGSSLSRGQVQRILLARAYYRQPALMLLDEPTSGLDCALERLVIAVLKDHSATTIVVSHSDLMLEAADEIYWLHEGTLRTSPPVPGRLRLN